MALIAPYALAGLVGRSWARPIAWLWHAATLRIVGLKLRVVGEPRRRGTTLFVANHVSYLDILALGRRLDGLFIAKSEIADWPGIGGLARLGGTIFIRREMEAVREQCEQLTAVLNSGNDVILFPEGTSGLGDGVLPFKTSLFEVSYMVRPETDLMVQPVAIAYLQADGQRCDNRRVRSLVAWYGRTTLAPHLWRFLGSRGAVVELRFLDPVKASDFAWRRPLAKACEASIERSLTA
ncbi:MAG TPA: lysophospholipid acyltransferase family protein [Alphaproteobacteria bacterium]|nr:lysophospholipid acyltransferase family protein [Alphaproteobacteria bacterium]